jgi:hypothetical protein
MVLGEQRNEKVVDTVHLPMHFPALWADAEPGIFHERAELPQSGRADQQSKAVTAASTKLTVPRFSGIDGCSLAAVFPA